MLLIFLLSATLLTSAHAQLPNPAVPAPVAPQQAPSIPTTSTPADSTPGVVLIPSTRIPAPPADARAAKAAARSPHKSKYEFNVPAAGWTDTGIDVRAGEQATVTATGSIVLGDGRSAGPAGLERGWKDLLRHFPLNSAPTGALIGRVTDLDASTPFLIGASGKAIMPTSGRLFLAVNSATDIAGTGEFKVKWAFDKLKDNRASTSTPTAIQTVNLGTAPAAEAPPAPAPAAAATTTLSPPAALTTLLSPATFDEIPRRVADAQGDPGDMVNFALLGTEAQVQAAFKAAGWVAVDKNVPDAIVHGILSTLSHEAYTEMPMSTLFLFGRAQDLSFARADPIEVAASRHHLRIWRTDKTVGGLTLWVGSATHDIGFERDRRNPKNITHKIDPDIDLERQFLLQSFDTAGQFSSAAYVTPTDPLREAQTATGGTFHSDGRILVMQLK